MNDFLNSQAGRLVLRLLLVVIAGMAKAGYIPLPLDTIGDIDVSDLMLASPALVPSAPKKDGAGALRS